ncbi:MAG: hypothetical protein NXI32_28395 [bacterium]|nr:hypothetical protein [bacterium]
MKGFAKSFQVESCYVVLADASIADPDQNLRKAAFLSLLLRESVPRNLIVGKPTLFTSLLPVFVQCLAETVVAAPRSVRFHGSQTKSVDVL